MARDGKPKCDVPRCARDADGASIWCKAHEQRLRNGWSIERASTQPLRPRGVGYAQQALDEAVAVLIHAGFIDAARLVERIKPPQRDRTNIHKRKSSGTIQHVADTHEGT